MEEFTIYCTEEQTKKALKLGAPIGKKIIAYSICTQPSSGYEEDFSEETDELIIPTAEQMIQWLEEQGIYAWVCPNFYEYDKVYNVSFVHNISKLRKPYISTGEKYDQSFHPSHKEAVLSAIDEALDYLIKNRQSE